MCIYVDQLCKAGLKTLQNLGPEIRLALNEDLDKEEVEEDDMIEGEKQEENSATYRVCPKVNATVTYKTTVRSLV